MRNERIFGLREAILVVASVALTMLVLRQIVSAGLSGDDVYRTHMVAYAVLHHMDLPHALLRAHEQWTRERGGFFPLQILAFAFWALDPSTGFALFVQLCFVGLNVATFAVLVRRMTGSLAAAWLAIACFFLVLELRLADDPVLSTLFVAPMTIEFVLAALLAWASYAESGRIRRLYVSLLFFACAVLSDAWAYPTAMCFALLAFMQVERLQAYVVASAYVLVPVAAFAYGTASGHGMPAGFGGNEIFGVAARMLSGLPTVYRATGALVRDGVSDFGGDHRFGVIPNAGFAGWLEACLIACIVFGVLRRPQKEGEPVPQLRGAIVVAGILWVAPALVVGSNAAYPAYFGVALALALLLCRVQANVTGERRFTFVAGVALVALFVMYGNARFNTYVTFLHRSADLPRQQIADAAQAGFFSYLAADASLAVPDTYPFRIGTNDYRDARNFFAHYTHRMYPVVPARAIETGGALCVSQREPVCRPTDARVWYLRLHAPQQVLGNPQITAAHWSHSIDRTIFTDKALGYRRYASDEETAGAWMLFAKSGRGFQGGNIGTDDRVVIVRAQRRCGPVPVQDAFAPNGARIFWGSGFYTHERYPRALISGAVQYIWNEEKFPLRRLAGSQAHLTIERDTCALGPLGVHMTIYTDAPAHLTVRFGSHAERYRVSAQGTDIDLLVPKSMPRRFDIVLQTDAVRAPEVLGTPRYERTDARDIRMYVVGPTAVPADGWHFECILRST